MDGWIIESYHTDFLQLPATKSLQKARQRKLVQKKWLKRKSNLTTNTTRRLIQLGRQSHPPDEQPIFIRIWQGKGRLEKAVHKKCSQFRMGNTEWFQIDLDKLFRLVQEVIDNEA